MIRFARSTFAVCCALVLGGCGEGALSSLSINESGESEVALSASAVMVSASRDRTSASPLDGKTLDGDAYIFVANASYITRVEFFVDDVQMERAPFQTENGAPWDLAGSEDNQLARPFRAGAMSAGTHAVTVRVRSRSGRLESATARFIRSGALVVTPPATPQTPVIPLQSLRVMPLGDSITEGWIHVYGGYRIRLWQRLVQTDKLPIDFVGSLSHGPAELGDKDHEGHSGYRIDQIRAGIDGWIAAARPDAVLLHLGTNDILQGYDLANAPARLEDLVRRICVDQPGVQILLASIITRPGLTQQIQAYNAKIPNIVTTVSATGCAVRYVNMSNALTGADLDESATHPTRAGYDKMADVWYPAVKALLE